MIKEFRLECFSGIVVIILLWESRLFGLKLRVLGCFFWLFFCAMGARAEPIEILVGGYPFEPFVEGNLGVTPGFIALLNSHQNRYRFKFVPIPAQRRYELLETGKIDAIFFEMRQWGWQNKKAVADVTRPIISGRELFVTLRTRKDAAFLLKEPTEQKMALTLGYHYAFADYNSDQDFLKGQFDTLFAPKQRTAIKYLVSGSADVAMASEIFLHAEYLRDSDLEQQLLLSSNEDQFYELPHLVRQGADITVEALHEILDSLVECECLSSFFASYGLQRLLTYPPE